MMRPPLNVVFCLPIILLSCGGGSGNVTGGGGNDGGVVSHPPVISNFSLSTGIASYDNASVSGNIDFQDSGGDITEIHLVVRDAHNVVIGVDNVTVQGAAGITSGAITILLNPSVLPTGTWGLDICISDARGASSNTLSTTVRIVPGFGPAIFYPNPIGPIYLGGIAVGDVNSDGRNDVAMIQIGYDVSYYVPGLVAVYKQNTAGRFDAGTIIQTSLTAGISGVSVVDVTGDGRPDLVMSGSVWPYEPFGWSNGRIVVYPQQPDGTLGGPVEYLVPLYYPFDLYGVGAFAVADVDGDGWNDVVVLSDGSIQVLYGNASGTLDNAVMILQGTTSFRAWGGIRAVDLDNDGRLEIIVQGWPTSIAIVRQIAPRSFASPDIYEIPIAGVRGPSVSSFAVGDLNGDGRIDILTIDNGNNFTVLQQTLSGTFNLQPSFNIFGVIPQNVGIVDIDGDGLNDILVRARNNILIMYQSANHAFDDRLTYGFPTQNGPEGSWALADVNSDGKPDLLMTWSSDGLYVKEQR